MEQEYFIQIFEAPTRPCRLVPKEDSSAVLANIRALYKSGQPLFTKGAMELIAHAFDEAAQYTDQENIVSIVGLDNVQVDFQLITGQLCQGIPVNDPNIELICTEPRLIYRSIDTLTNDWPVHPIWAYLPFAIYHNVERRNRMTGVVLPSWEFAAPTEIQQAFHQNMLRWQATSHFEALRTMLTNQVAAMPSKIEKIVAFSCSTMTFADAFNTISATQHALIVYLREFLLSRQQCSRSISCYAQDPIYKGADRNILSEAGITVLEDPRGFLEVDETSVVISIASDIPVRQIVTDIARPALIIWDRVSEEDTEDKSLFESDSATDRVIRMIRSDYIEIDFPTGEGFDNVCLYIRREKALM